MTSEVENSGTPVADGAQDLGEAEAWAEVEKAWEDEARHRSYLARFSSLDELAMAGRRYRAVLAERPGDAVALRFRDEIVKRATVQGLASLPRTQAKPETASGLRRAAGLIALLMLVVLGWVAVRELAPFVGAHP